MTRRRPLKTYLPILAVIFLLGIPARTVSEHLPKWYVVYAGDFLWAMLLFFLCAVAFRRSTLWTFLVTLGIAWLIEISQLYHAPWIDELRNIWALELVLGKGFLWSDVVAYAAGVSLGAGADHLIAAADRKPPG